MAWLGRTRHVHFVGVGGIGMSGIAELLLNLGYEVSGSDARRSDVTDRLALLGVRVGIGHDASNVGDADVVVVSSAIPVTNPEVAHARLRHVPVIPRAEMLAELMRLRFGIAIAGAHGKTTTTSMVALVLERAGLDPTAVIGGRLSAFGSNARLGRGEYMVAEADESDRSFLKLSPSIAVVTNIDREHLDSYGSFDRLVDAFADFAGRVPFYGAVVACVDDPPVAGLLPRLDRRTITYGFSVPADVRGLAPASDGRSARCGVHYRIRGLPGGAGEGEITLAVPGIHNLQNALAAVAVGLDLGVSFGQIAQALAGFTGAERRCELRLGARCDGRRRLATTQPRSPLSSRRARNRRGSSPSSSAPLYESATCSRTLGPRWRWPMSSFSPTSIGGEYRRWRHAGSTVGGRPRAQQTCRWCRA
jgi:UDP-N-acetylmuramate--alanine ligase